jgi:hypothetical protein
VKPDLIELMARLQRELRLQDWRIDVSYVRDLCASDGTVVHGLCYSLVDAKTARIEIRDPETPAGDNDPTVEETLVHELVHLHFAPLSGFTQADIAVEEQAVWALSEAICNAKNDASRRAQIARAMVAFTKRATGRSAPRSQTRKQGVQMDLAMLLVALKAAVASGDMKQVEALIAEIEAANGTTAADPVDPAADPAMAQEAEEEPRQAAAEEEPKAARALLAQARALVAPRRAAVAPAKPASGVSRGEFERAMGTMHIDRFGAHLTDAQKKFAARLTYDGVREFVASIPVTQAAAGTVRNQRPAGGPPGGAGAPANRDIAEVDRRMGLAKNDVQAVSRNPVTGRLQISNVATNAVVKGVA